MNIILIGYRGTGKSVVGQILSKELNMIIVGMDNNIVTNAGMPIPDIVEQFGWDRFRQLETKEAMIIAKKDNQIVDTGGGIIERSKNMDVLGKTGPVFWLRASVETIIDRIQDDTQRPALVEGKTFIEEVAGVLEKRNAKYQAASQFEIHTDGLAPEQVAKKIIDRIIRINNETSK